MIGIVNYGAGNMGSLSNALNYLNIEIRVSSDPQELVLCDSLILPGVGAFGAAMEQLEKLDLISFLQDWGETEKPLLGICLGMQLLLSSSEEGGSHQGLNLIPGKVLRLTDPPRSIHIGWNQVKPTGDNLFLPESGFAYFVHSYVCRPKDKQTVKGETEYGNNFPSVIQLGHVIGAQFHPEKSQAYGLNMLKRFADGKI